MWIRLIVTVLVMHAVDRDPSRGTVLQIAHAQNREAMFKPFRTCESAVSQQPMIADGDAHHAEYEVTKNPRINPDHVKNQGTRANSETQVNCRQCRDRVPKNANGLSLLGPGKSLWINRHPPAGESDESSTSIDESSIVAVSVLGSSISHF